MTDARAKLKQANAERELLLLAYNALTGGGINRHPSGTFTRIVEKLSDCAERIARLEKEVDANA